MVETLTFAQCLAKVMRKHQLSLGNLATLIGSRADLKHVLADGATHAKRCRLFEKLKNSHLFDEADYEQLAHSLEISRMGVEQFRFEQAIDAILSGRTPEILHELVTDSGLPLKERLALLDQAEKIEILCFNCCFHSLFAVLSPLFAKPECDLSMKHYIQSDSSINAAAEYVSVVMPVLFDRRYVSFYRPQFLELKIPSIGGNLLLIRAIIGNAISEFVFVLSSDTLAYELPNASSCYLFSFISKVLQGVPIQPIAIKESSPYKLDFSSLCMTFLSHELNRATYYIGCDLCFQQTPTDIALAAFRDKGLPSETEAAQIISRTLSIHEQRYQNQYNKRKPTYRIMTKAGCERFLKTGEATDHFAGFRPFTLEERKVIFANMLHAARENQYFIPLLLIDDSFTHSYNLVCYEKLGISIDTKNTDYDISKGYRSVFLMLPEFTKQYLTYYLDILVAEKCYSRKQSLEMLESMYEQFLSANHLQNQSKEAPESLNRSPSSRQ